MVLAKLFLVFFRIGLFAIGGAYSFLPLLEREVVDKYNWLTKNEFMEVFGMFRITPGAISIKYATYTGYKIAGIPGAFVANMGNLLAPILIVAFFWFFYMKYKDLPKVKSAFNAIQLVVFAMIIAVAFRLVNVSQLVQLKGFFIVVVSFALFTYTKIHPAIIIVGAGVLGAFLK